MNVLVQCYILILHSVCLVLAYKMPVIDKDCILMISRDNQTFKFNLSRALSQEINDIPYNEDSLPAGLSTSNFSEISIALGICHELPTQCSALTCLHLKNNDNLLDIGSTLISANYYDELLKITLNSTSRCPESSLHNYSTTIVHRCVKENPSIVFDKYNECNFRIMWMSSIGCPLKEYSTINSCLLTTPTARYDLRALSKYSGYEYHLHADIANDLDIYFNLCGYIASSRCGPNVYLCEISKGNGGNTLAVGLSTEFILTEVDHSKVSLVFYKSNGGKIVISLVCESGLINPILEYSHQHDRDIYLILRNTIICRTEPLDCLMYEKKEGYDEKDVYNLSVLRKYNGNWKIFDKAGNELIFNVCGTLNYEPNLICAGGNVFACYKSNQTNQTSIIGTSQKPAVLHRHGYVSFNYSGGMYDSRTPYILNVSLICSTSDSKPSLRSVNSSYFILWYTRAACPTQYYTGSKCIANDINVNYLFNETTQYYSIKTSNNDKYLINLCHPLARSCAGEENVSVCWINENGHEIAIGYAGFEPVYTEGHIEFVIKGKPCHYNLSRSIVFVQLRCDYSAYNTPPVLISKNVNCEFNFIWYTNVVCKERTIIDCKVENKNKKYDLTALIRNNSNYKVEIDNGVFFINICQSIVPGPDIKCNSLPSSVGACYFNEHFQQVNAGSISSSLKIMNNSLQLSYMSGDICFDGNARPDYNTIINFFCTPDANVSGPVFLNYHECVYTFEWHSRFACPILIENKDDENDVKSSSEVKTQHGGDIKYTTVSTELPIDRTTCTVQNPYNNYLFDLRPLMEKDWTIDKSLRISICRPLRSSGCPHSSGSCLNASNKFIDMGSANADLKYKDGIVYLNYTGSKCRNTLIYFYCHEFSEASVEEDIDHCITVIHWNTPLACQTDLRDYCCENNSGSLCSVRDTYPVSVSNETLYLSICKFPKVQPELSCRKTVDCLGSNTYSNTFTKRHELFQKNSIQFIEFQHIFGKICSGQVQRWYTITLKLYCDRNILQNGPMFVSKTNDCNFNLEWRSNYFCKDVIDDKSLTSCKSLGNSKLQRIIENVQHAAIKNITSRYSDNSYYFNFCDKSNICKTDICKRTGTNVWNSFARIHHITTGRNPNITILHYTLLASQDSGLCGAEVRLSCNASKDEGKPVIINESGCNLEVNWETRLACMNEGGGVDPVLLVTSASTHHNPIAITFIVLLVSIVICTSGFVIWKKWPTIQLMSCRRFRYTQPSYSEMGVLSPINIYDEDEEIIFKVHHQ